MKKQTKKCQTQKRKRGGKRKTLKKGGHDSNIRNSTITNLHDPFALRGPASLESAVPGSNKLIPGEVVGEPVGEPEPVSTLENEGYMDNLTALDDALFLIDDEQQVRRKKRLNAKVERINEELNKLDHLRLSDNIDDIRKAINKLNNKKMNKKKEHVIESLNSIGEQEQATALKNRYESIKGAMEEKIITFQRSQEKARKDAEKAAAQKAAAQKAKNAAMKELTEKAEEEARKKAEEEARKKSTAIVVRKKQENEQKRQEKPCLQDSYKIEDLKDISGNCTQDYTKYRSILTELRKELRPECTSKSEYSDINAESLKCLKKIRENGKNGKPPPTTFTNLLNESMKEESQRPISEVNKNNQGSVFNRFGKAVAAAAAAVGKATNAMNPTNNKKPTENRVVIRNPEPDVDTRDIVVPEYTQQYINRKPDNLPRYHATPTDAQPLVRYEEPRPPIPLNKEDEEVEVESNAIVNPVVASDAEPVAETTDEEQSYALTLLSNPVKNMQQIASQISDALVVVPNKPDAPKPKQTTPPARFYKSMRPATETLIRKNLDNGLIAMLEYMEHTPTRGDYSDSAYARFEKKTAKGKDTWDIDIRQTPNGYKYITVDSSGNDSEAYRTGDDADRKIRVAVRNEIMKRLKDGYVPANTTRKLKDKSNNKDIAETRRLYRNRKGVYESSYKPTSTKQTTASRRTRKLRSNRIARKHIADSAEIDENREKLAAERAAERANKKKEAEKAANNTDANQ